MLHETESKTVHKDDESDRLRKKKLKTKVRICRVF